MHGCCPKNEKPEKDAWKKNWWVAWVGTIILGAVLGFAAGLLLAVGLGIFSQPFDFPLLMITSTATGIFCIVAVAMIFS